ncbi:hypothetical protein TEA_025366 [Camellia sinensis var. sinensis]|uniref:ditrans,polycis-polyprenyl diphosphate synthase [(2E,6E)-farnesyldiphosphate specific] n=1 Tax=Camellia sinensis var. sinensis TaxID=542762 RepID=A0A4V3WIR6_CAMSN|nr:hypothetical protein TEA_025366 [Camellia sinensis var. sinensis]
MLSRSETLSLRLSILSSHFSSLILFIFRNFRIMDLRVEMQRVFYRTGQIGNFVLLLLWHILHFMIRIWYFARGIADMLESYLISSGLLKGYNTLNLDNLQNLAIVVDSEEAHQPSKVAELLLWLASLGVKNVYLYDIEGVLKKSKEAILERLVVAILSDKVTLRNYPLLDRKPNLEFVSYSDGKEAVAKAASLLFQKHYLGREEKEPPIFTESHVSEALSAVGSGGPDLDLLLVYGPARCHLGFPPWQIRYTEIICIVLQTSEDLVHLFQTYGAIEVHEIWFPNKSDAEVLNGAPELRKMMNCIWGIRRIDYGEMSNIWLM